MSDKSTRWAFTAYVDQWSLFDTKPDIVKTWMWNHEKCPKTGKEHYQGCLITIRQVRFGQLQKALPGVHIEVAKNWDALVQYCKKSDTQVEGGKHHHEDVPRVTVTMDEALIRVAKYRDRDVKFVNEKLREQFATEYRRSVASILTEDSSLIGLYAQPIFRNAYIDYRDVWVSKADVEEIDRQTDRQMTFEEFSAGMDAFFGVEKRSPGPPAAFAE